jgi:hypothetical protein
MYTNIYVYTYAVGVGLLPQGGGAVDNDIDDFMHMVETLERLDDSDEEVSEGDDYPLNPLTPILLTPIPLTPIPLTFTP